MKNKQYLALALIVSSLIITTGCGKMSAPKPPKSNEEITWEAVGGQAASNNCIFIQANLAGAISNLSDVILEIEPIDGESCITCPFTPREKQRYSAWSLGLDKNNSSFSKTYCPQIKGEGMRWRLVATNSYLNLANAISSEVLTYFKDAKAKK